MIESRNADIEMRRSVDVSSIMFNERGSVMMIVLLVLSLLTILGLSSSKTSFTEMQISTNQTIYKQNFYEADAAINEASQMFGNIGSDMEDNPPTWMLPMTTALLPAVTSSATQGDEYVTVTGDAIWNRDADADGTLDNTFTSVAFPTAQVMSVHRGIAPGSSLGLGAARLHIFEFYSRSRQNNGVVVLKSGYRQPY